MPEKLDSRDYIALGRTRCPHCLEQGTTDTSDSKTWFFHDEKITVPRSCSSCKGEWYDIYVILKR